MRGVLWIWPVLALGVLAPGELLAQRPAWPAPPEPEAVELEFGVQIPLRDGVSATVTIYRPAERREPLPAILLITPYMADAFHATAMYFAQRGYVFVTADTRGRGHSGGEWKPFVQDGPDGHDIVEWLARQPWSDGQVAMAGISYLGFTQWTTLKEFPPHLRSIVPTAPAYFSYTSLKPYNIFSTYAIRWLSGVSGRSLNGQWVADAAYWDRIFWNWYSNHLPYAVLDSVAGNRTTELRTWIRHPAVDAYVDDTAVAIEDYPRIDIPILSITGHFDGEQRATMRHYRRHMEYGTEAAKAKHFLVIGPWDHVATFWPRAQIGGLDFDSVSVLDIGSLHTEWYDWTLKGGARPGFLRNRVAYYLMGAEEWRYADDLAGVSTDSRVLYLGAARGNPTELARAGTLDAGAPGAAATAAAWVYDPLDTRPGERELRSPQGYITPADSLDLFGAGLVYETPPLREPLDLAGYIRLRLWLSMDVPDTDFGARLYEVTEDGQAIFLTRQLQRARYRESLEYERLVTPGEVTPFVLDDFDFFARRVRAGSRIRLVIAALNSPYYEKNYNTGGVVALESGRDARTARVTLHQDAGRPSALELPIAAPTRLAAAAAPEASGSSRRDPAHVLVSADALFRAGRFPEAEKLYASAASLEPANHRATVQLGRIALLSNRFEQAERWLTAALELDADDTTARNLLAETHYRQDRFRPAAALLAGGTGEQEVKARLLETFADLTPYAMEARGEEARLPFVQTDPIPVVRVRVNGREANFILDTGGSEVYLEPHFAESIGAAVVTGSVTGGFAGGQTRPVRKGRIDELTLDRFTVRNVPVNIVDTEFIGRDRVAPGLEISGFLGTVLLYHFLPTIDYVNRELVLRPKTEENLRRLEREAERDGQVVLPFWMTGSHLMVAWGSAHRGEPRLLLVDTGGAGIGFVPGPTLVREAGIELPGGTPEPEPGGRFVPVRFTADAVSLGPLTEREVPSVFGALPPRMEQSLGFHLAGIVSHAFFRPYALTIDFTGMRFFLKRGD